MSLSHVKKIAILRANALGDFIFALPGLQALRETFPNAELILLGKSWHKEFLAHRPSPVDRVVVVPKYPGVGENELYHPDENELDVFFKTMHREKFDIAIQLHGGGKNSNPFVKNLTAKLSIGLQASDAISLDRTIPYVYYQNEYLRYLETVLLIGAKTRDPIPSIQATHNDIQKAVHAFSQHDQPFVVLHPGASDIRRRWKTKYFSIIGDFLAKKGFLIVVTGSGNENNIIEEVLHYMQHPAFNFYNKLSLSGLTGLLSLSSLVISNDTGPFHLSYALGTPSIGLFWCGNMINGAPLTREKTRPLISWTTHCPLCNTNCSDTFPSQPQSTCAHTTSFISNISHAQVEQTIDEMIGQHIVSRKRKQSKFSNTYRQHLYGE